MENHGQKRTAEEQNDLLDGVKAVLLDIEGTTTPISFVKDKLFPYVRDNLQSHLEGHWEDEECQADVDALRAQAASDKEANVEGAVEIPATDANQADIVKACIDNVLAQMDADRKLTSLKQLQGHMWREAYKTGKVAGEVYDDVPPALRDWISAGVKVFVYSSGSEEAQKLLFGYSDKGNLAEFFSGFFDTNVGAKVDKESYLKIAEKAGVDAEDMLFLTDLPAEAKAATEAGMRSCIVVREGNAPLSDEDIQKFNAITCFSDLFGDVMGDAKRLEGEDDDDDEDEEDDDEDVDGEEGEEEEGEEAPEGEGEEEAPSQ